MMRDVDAPNGIKRGTVGLGGHVTCKFDIIQHEIP